MGNVRGTLQLVFPAVVSNTILRRLVEERGSGRRRSGDARARIEERLEAARVGASLHLPPVRIPARELERMAPGMVLRLPLAADQAAELRIGGVTVFRALPARRGEQRAAQLTARAEVNKAAS